MSTGVALNNPQAWITAGSQVQDGGRCFSFAARVAHDLAARLSCGIEVMGSRDYDHYFVVVGRPAGSTLNMSTWHANTIIVDAWAANSENRNSPCYAPHSFRYRTNLVFFCTIR
jgi:hypothetical protein